MPAFFSVLYFVLVERERETQLAVILMCWAAVFQVLYRSDALQRSQRHCRRESYKADSLSSLFLDLLTLSSLIYAQCCRSPTRTVDCKC